MLSQPHGPRLALVPGKVLGPEDIVFGGIHIGPSDAAGSVRHVLHRNVLALLRGVFTSPRS